MTSKIYDLIDPTLHQQVDRFIQDTDLANLTSNEILYLFNEYRQYEMDIRVSSDRVTEVYGTLPSSTIISGGSYVRLPNL